MKKKFVFLIMEAIEKLGQKVTVSNDHDIILNSTHIILPGVGAFGKAMDSIRNLNLDKVLIQCGKDNKFIMGICLGMQLLCSDSEEFEFNKGLDMIPGRVVSLKNILNEKKIKVPNIGWLNLIKKNNKETNQICDQINKKESF